MTSPNHRLSLEEVLDEFFFAAKKPTTAMVLRACEAYPEYREDIMEFAALWTSYETAEEPTDAISLTVADDDVARLQSFVLNRLHQLDHESERTNQDDIEVAKNALTTLAGGTLRRAAAAADLGSATVLLQKILTNSITNVPTKVLAGLSSYMNVTLTALQGAIAERRLAIDRRYNASNKPTTPGKESWESAVRSLSLPRDEKERLLELRN